MARARAQPASARPRETTIRPARARMGMIAHPFGPMLAARWRSVKPAPPQAPLAEEAERGPPLLEDGLDQQERSRRRRGHVHHVPRGLQPASLPQEPVRRVGLPARDVPPEPRRARGPADRDQGATLLERER